MKVLIAHNRYRHPGGEDAVVAAERALLARHGHEVRLYLERNRRMASMSRVRMAASTIWASASRRALLARFRRNRPDVVHMHNTFALLSPSAYHACREAGLPVVQTLHNYRMLCPAATLFRNGQICERCMGRTVPWPAVRHACYHESRVASGVVATMLTACRALGAWNEQVDAYIAPTEFARRKFIEGGFPADRITVKPHFIHPDPGAGAHRGGYALYVGRLEPEKGIPTLLSAWARLHAEASLKIVGDGPLASRADRSPRGVEWLGPLPRHRVLELMREAAFLVFPSESYETFGMVAVEAFATGLPVIASRLGAPGEVVRDGATGRLVAAAQPEALAAAMEWGFRHPERLAEMGRRARDDFEAKYTAERNHEALLAIYRLAIERVRANA